MKKLITLLMVLLMSGVVLAAPLPFPLSVQVYGDPYTSYQVTITNLRDRFTQTYSTDVDRGIIFIDSWGDVDVYFVIGDSLQFEVNGQVYTVDTTGMPYLEEKIYMDGYVPPTTTIPPETTTTTTTTTTLATTTTLPEPTTTTTTTTSTTTTTIPPETETDWMTFIYGGVVALFAWLVARFVPYNGKTKIERVKTTKGYFIKTMVYKSYTKRDGTTGYHWVTISSVKG